MKRFLILLLLCGLGLFGTVPAHSAENGVRGLYVGGKLGMSAEQFSSSKIGLEKGEASFPLPFGDLSWNKQSFGMGNHNDTVFAGGMTLGYDFCKHFDIPVRIELDYTLRGKGSDSKKHNLPFEYTSSVSGDFIAVTAAKMKNSLNLQTIMLNTWWDINTGTAFTPYIGGGVGMAFGKFKSIVIDTEEGDALNAKDTFTKFAWSLGGGLAYDFNDSWTVDLGYRYINAGHHKMTYDNPVTYIKIDRIESHDVMLGIRYTF